MDGIRKGYLFVRNGISKGKVNLSLVSLWSDKVK